MRVGELQTILSNIYELFASAGAKTAAKELQIFCNALEPYADVPLAKACADIKHHLVQPATKTARRGKTTGTSGAPDENVILRHITELRAAGTDAQAFSLAFKTLKASKAVKSAELSEIARQFSLGAIRYKTKAAAYADIERAFVRQARFENKLR